MDKTALSKALAIIFFISLLLVDWLYILSIQNQAPIISHWVIALPIIIPLFFAITLLALIGIYLSNVWGFILSYFTILLSMYFVYISYTSIALSLEQIDFDFIFLILLNLVIFCYIAFFHARLQNTPS